jgi:capsular exopolysaccharide synthesis family protein
MTSAIVAAKIRRKPDTVRTAKVRAGLERQTPELRDYLAILWRRKWTIALATIAAVSLSLLNSYREQPTYVSTAEVLVRPIRDPSQPFATNVLMQNEVRIASSEPVRSLAYEDLPEGVDTLGTILVTAVPESETLIFNGRAGDGATAALTAQRYADAYLAFREATLFQSVDAQQEAIDGLIGDLLGQLEQAESVTDRVELQRQISEYQSQSNDLALVRGQRVGEILQAAVEPQSPASPNHLKALVLGLLLGLIAGIALALLRERLDPLVRNREEVEAATGMSILGMIPTSHAKARVKGGVLSLAELLKDPLVAESFRGLRSRLLFIASQQRLRTIVMTSSKEAEGKTTTSLGLARTLAEAGNRVVFVAADLRRPSLDRFVPEARNRQGLSDVLAGSLELDHAIVPTSVENLRVIPHGRSGHHTEKGLATLPISDVLGALEDEADFVIVDTTPVLGASDALDLVPSADGVIFAIDARTTTRSEIASAITDLHSVGAPLLGVVMTNYDPARFRPRAHYYSTWPQEPPAEIVPPAGARVASEEPVVLASRPRRRRGTGTSSMP